MEKCLRQIAESVGGFKKLPARARFAHPRTDVTGHVTYAER